MLSSLSALLGRSGGGYQWGAVPPSPVWGGMPARGTMMQPGGGMPGGPPIRGTMALPGINLGALGGPTAPNMPAQPPMWGGMQQPMQQPPSMPSPPMQWGQQPPGMQPGPIGAPQWGQQPPGMMPGPVGPMQPIQGPWGAQLSQAGPQNPQNVLMQLRQPMRPQY